MNRKRDFEGLDKANSLSKSGKHQEAMQYYQAILANYPNHPAILMNKALGQYNGNDQSSLRACNHYRPVLKMLNQ
jgi:tetratricopeptide (TPR) repeat protein